MAEIKQSFVVDGKIFDTKAEAENFIRRPKVEAAMSKLTGGNKELTTWLVDNQEAVEMAFETGTIRRVTKVESNRLAKALEALGKIEGNPAIKFLQDNAAAIQDSFRWPSVKRMTAEEKTVAARNTLVAATEGNEDLAKWVLDNQAAVLEAYAAGIVKREVSPKATEALAAYRAKMAAQKAEADAKGAETGNTETAPAADAAV